MVRKDEGVRVPDPLPQIEGVFETVAALAEYTREAGLTRADELLVEVIALMLLRRSADQST